MVASNQSSSTQSTTIQTSRGTLQLARLRGHQLNLLHNSAVAAAIEHLTSADGICYPSDSVPTPRVVLLSRNVLHFSEDDKSAFVHEYMHYGRFYRRRVILGMNYYFTLEWDLPWATLPEVPMSARLSGDRPYWTVAHEFLVTRDRTDTYNVLSHTAKLRPYEPALTWPNYNLTYSSNQSQWVFHVRSPVLRCGDSAARALV